MQQTASPETHRRQSGTGSSHNADRSSGLDPSTPESSRLINRGQRLGESTLDPGNPGQVRQSERISELLEAGDDSLVLVDVTPVNRTRNFHNFSLETPEFFDDLFLRLIHDTVP